MNKKPAAGKTERFIVISGAIFLVLGFGFWILGVGIAYGFDSIANWFMNSREAKILVAILCCYGLFLCWWVHRLFEPKED